MQWKTVSKEEKHRKRKEWHLFFPLFPRKITCDLNGENRWAWLETIGRKSVREHDYEGGSFWMNEYASKEDAMFYMMGGEEPKKTYGLRPTSPPPMPAVKPPAPPRKKIT